MKKGAGMPYWHEPSEKKQWNSCLHGCQCHRCVDDIPMIHNAATCAVERAGEVKDRSFNKITANWVVTQFSILLLNDLSFPSPNDVIRQRPLSLSLL